MFSLNTHTKQIIEKGREAKASNISDGAFCFVARSLQHAGAHRRCTNSGSAGGGCGTEIFPRSDPVAIVLAQHGDECLLTRKAAFAPVTDQCTIMRASAVVTGSYLLSAFP